MKFVSLKQLLFNVFEIEHANAVELLVVSMKMNETMAKRKIVKLDHPSHNQAVERERL